KQLADWLRQADPENLLMIEETSHRMSERKIGVYTAPGLRILFGAGATEIRVEPIARYAMGPVLGDAFPASTREGRVDITNDEHKYMLYRIKDASNHRWLIVDDKDYRIRELDRTTFEAAIQ